MERTPSQLADCWDLDISENNKSENAFGLLSYSSIKLVFSGSRIMGLRVMDISQNHKMQNNQPEM